MNLDELVEFANAQRRIVEEKGQMNLDELVEFANAAAEKIFKMHGEVPPIYFMITEQDEFLIVPGRFDDNQDSAALVRSIMAIHHVVRYVSVDEAWTVPVGAIDAEITRATEDINNMGGARDHPDRFKVLMARDHPDHVKVLMLVAEDCREGFQSYQRDIIRAPGKRARLGPLIRDEYTWSEGRLVDMLPRPQGARIQ